MFNAVKTPLTLAAIAVLSAACSSGGGSSFGVPGVSSAVPAAPAATYTTSAPMIETAPIGGYTQPASYVSSQPAVYSTAPTVDYGVTQPVMIESAQFPAVGQTTIQPATTATYSGVPAYQAAPLQTTNYSIPAVPAQPSGAALIQSGATTAATAPSASAAAESIMIQGANAGMNYGANRLLAQ